MGAEAEPEQIRLVCVGNDEIATSDHVRKWMETQPLEDIEVTAQFDVELPSALEILENGDADLIAISASNWYLCKGAPDTMVAAALPRRDENHILVADDRIAYLPHKSIILANNRLQRRQLRRYRPDFRVLDPVAFADMIGRKLPDDSGLALQAWMEDLRATKIIGGYVSERHLFDIANIDSRRHKLMTDSRENSARFLPSPLNGLTLLVSREGFPMSLSERIGDIESLTAWSCEKIILEQIDPELHDRVGLIVRHRQVPSLLNQAEQEKDLLRSTALTNPEGEIISPPSYAHGVKSWKYDPSKLSGVSPEEMWLRVGTNQMVETIIETIDRSGNRTLLLERLNWKDEDSVNVRLIAREWEEMLALVTKEHAEDIRLGPARPAFLDL